MQRQRQQLAAAAAITSSAVSRLGSKGICPYTHFTDTQRTYARRQRATGRQRRSVEEELMPIRWCVLRNIFGRVWM